MTKLGGELADQLVTGRDKSYALEVPETWNAQGRHEVPMAIMQEKSQRAPNPPEFAQPRLSRAKSHRSNTPKFVASHLCNTSHIGANTPKFVPSRSG